MSDERDDPSRFVIIDGLPFTVCDTAGAGWYRLRRDGKRAFRKAWQERHSLPKRRAKGWRRHVRKAKAKL